MGSGFGQASAITSADVFPSKQMRGCFHLAGMRVFGLHVNRWACESQHILSVMNVLVSACSLSAPSHWNCSVFLRRAASLIRTIVTQFNWLCGLGSHRMLAEVIAYEREREWADDERSQNLAKTLSYTCRIMDLLSFFNYRMTWGWYRRMSAEA